jgi:hypothetical protein
MYESWRNIKDGMSEDHINRNFQIGNIVSSDLIRYTLMNKS